MAHICRLLVLDMEDAIGRYEPDGTERYDNYNLESAIIYCEDLIGAGHAICPVQGWGLDRMLTFARARVQSPAQRTASE